MRRKTPAPTEEKPWPSWQSCWRSFPAPKRAQINENKGTSIMELNSKQRAQLRGLANSIEVILHIGKDGITDNVVKQANDALEARELIKCKVLENSMLTAREACDQLSLLTRSEQVQVIGTKFILYRESHKKGKTDKIVLVKDKKKKPQA
jgi:RNA-binding protein